jgi:hypothetical protein
MNELVRKGLVVHDKIAIDITGKRVNYWKVKGE